MLPGLTIGGITKVISTMLLTFGMLICSPTIVQHFHWTAMQATMPERVATTEAKTQALEQHVNELEIINNKLVERIAVVETRQEMVLAGLLPVALFMITSSIESWQRMRGKAKRNKEESDEQY